MFAFFHNAVVLLAASGGSGQGGFTEFYNTYLNYPGFELWKFINLAIFIGVMIYVAKKPLSEAFKAKRDAIRAELIRAEQEKKAALDRLTSAEAKLASLEAEKAALLQKARVEAEAEKHRLAEQAEWEVSKLREQTSGEVDRLRKQTLAQLRRFSAEESVRLAEEKLKAQLDTQKDSQLVKAGIASIGGLN
jgi:F0F1-type ATP synthase membrane subunit b/b'